MTSAFMLVVFNVIGIVGGVRGNTRAVGKSLVGAEEEMGGEN